jgi:hypothetical protein
MAERLITPEDFATGAPPRIMGTEAEDHVNLRDHRKNATTRSEIKDEDTRAIMSMMSPRNFKKAGITVYQPYAADSWLSNGQRIYPDMSLFESCTAEQLGPKKTLSGTLAAIKVVQTLARVSELDVRIFRRSATVEGQSVNKTGFHMNHITSEKAAFRIKDNSVLKTHAATRLYTWAGMVAPEGYVLSQKAYALKESRFKDKTDEDNGFARIEDYTGDDSSPWGTFMAMATTSVLMRVFEHPQEIDLNKKLTKLMLSGSSNAEEIVSTDMTFNEKLRLSDGREMTAIQIQTELADIAAEFGKRFQLPDDEQYAVAEWQRVCSDLEETAKTGDIRPLATRIGWASKKLWLERKNSGPLQANNDEAVMLDMSWDSYCPKEGGRLLYPKKTGLTIVSDAQVAALVHNPPDDTRAKVRGGYVENPAISIKSISWGDITIKSHKVMSGGQKNEIRTESLHPYQTSE